MLSWLLIAGSAMQEAIGRHFNNAVLTVTVVVAVCVGWYAPAYYRTAPTDADFDLIARVAAGEARSQTNAEIAAVCHVIHNRVLLGSWGGYSGVVTARKQFSAMNAGDPNRVVITSPGFAKTREYERALRICAETIIGRIDGSVSDPTSGADHFHSGVKRPWWVKGRQPLVQIGVFRFYRLRQPRRC